MKYEYTHFIPENVAPKGATRIVVKKGDEEVASIPASRFGGLSRPLGEPDYSVGWVSDCHTFKTEIYADATWMGNHKLKNALNYFVKRRCIMVIGCGDYTQTGFYRQNESRSSITISNNVIPVRDPVVIQPYGYYYDETQMLNHSEIIKAADIPVHEIFGNHENYGVAITAETTIGGVVYKSLARAKELTGIPATAYTVSSSPDSDTVEGTTVRPNRYAPVDDDLYILCGQSTSGEVMSADDFTWLGNILEANKTRRCFVVVHSYMEEDSGDPLDYRENSIFGTWTKTAEFVALLKQYPNVILFHGHSHMKFKHQAVDPLANYATVKGYKSVHVPSLGMPRDINPNATDGKYTPEDINSSQCYIMDVYKDCIVLNGLELGTTGVPSVEVLGTLKINT